MASWWSNLIDSGLSADEVEPTLLERIRIANIGLVVMVAIALPFSVQYLRLGLPHMVFAVLAAAAVAMVSLWRLRRNHHPGQAGLVAGLTVFALLVTSNVTSGGFYDPNFAWLYVVPLIGALVATRRTIWLFGGLVLAATVVFWALPQMGVPIVSRVPAESRELQSLFNRLSAVATIVLLVVAIVARHRRNEHRIERLASYDVLTGLPNRRLLERRLEHLVARAQAKGEQTAVVLVDLDRFKTINDTLGHRGGDALLCEVARRIGRTAATPPHGEHLVARFGGDEFVVVYECCPPGQWLERAANQLVADLQRPFFVGDYELFPGGSVGLAVARPDEPWEDVMRRADNALYEAKRRGGGCLVRSTAALIEAEERRLHLESMLRRAVERGELSVAYQPLVRTADRSIVACEALVRWTTRDGPVSPVEFIPIAEQTGEIIRVGRFVLERACEQAAAWQREGLPAVRMSVNVSAIQLQSEGFVEMVESALATAGLEPGQIELELTESALIDGNELSQRTIATLAERGVGFALDDFGTGYSSLSYLSRFPFETLKIDSSFVLAAPERRHDADLVGAITMLGQRMSLRVVAEGVETEAHVELLTALGCDELQGYCFSRPIDGEAFGELLAAQAGTPPERARVVS